MYQAIACVVVFLTVAAPGWANVGELDRLAALQTVERLFEEGKEAEGRERADELYEASKQALEAGDDSAANLYVLGAVSRLRGKRYLALSYLQRATEADPGSLPAQLFYAKALVDLGRLEKAMAALERAKEIIGPEEGLERARAEILFDQSRDAEAIEILERQWSGELSDRRTFDLLLNLYIRNGETQKAEALLDQLVEVGEIAEADKNLHLAQAATEANLFREARRYFQLARRADPDHPALGERLGRFYERSADAAMAEGQTSRALLYWQRALEFDPQNRAIRYKIGSARLEMGEAERALELLKELIDDPPADPRYYSDIARAFHATGQPEIAYGTLAKALEVAEEKGNDEAYQLFSDTQEELIKKDRQAAAGQLEHP